MPPPITRTSTKGVDNNSAIAMTDSAIAAIALSVTAMALLLSTPFVDVLVIGGGIRWLSAFGVVIAIGVSAAAVAIVITVLLFRSIGPSRTRLVAQIVSAVIGAGFVIALQVAAIFSYGTLSRFAVLTSDAATAFAPDLDSPVWWPAHAALGNGEVLSLLLAASLVLLGGVMAILSPRFAHTWKLFGESAAAERHLGCEFPDDHQVEAALAALARFDDFSVSPALLDSFVSVQAEASHADIRAMTAGATRIEDRRDILREGRSVLGGQKCTG